MGSIVTCMAAGAGAAALVAVGCGGEAVVAACSAAWVVAMGVAVGMFVGWAGGGASSGEQAMSTMAVTAMRKQASLAFIKGCECGFEVSWRLERRGLSEKYREPAMTDGSELRGGPGFGLWTDVDAFWAVSGADVAETAFLGAGHPFGWGVVCDAANC